MRSTGASRVCLVRDDLLEVNHAPTLGGEDLLPLPALQVEGGPQRPLTRESVDVIARSMAHRAVHSGTATMHDKTREGKGRGEH